MSPSKPRRHVATEAWYGLCTQVVDKILPVAIVLYLARVVTPEQFGVYSFVIAYLAFFQILVEQTLDVVIVRMVMQAPAERLVIFRAALGLRLLVGTLAAAAAVALVGWISGGRVSAGLMLLAALSLVSALGAAYRAIFRADLNIRAVFAIALTRALLLAAAVVIALAVRPGLPGLFLAMAVANLVTFVVVAVAARATIPLGLSARSDLWRTLVRGAVPIALNALAITISLRAGLVILMSLRGPVEVGLLGAASRVIEAFTLLPEALMITVYPVMAGLHGSDVERLISTAGKSVRYLVLATGVPVVVCAVAGADVMRILFGARFAEAGPVLAFLGSMALLSATGTVVLNLLIAVHRETILYRNTMVFALLNVVLCFPLISRYGYAGAAMSMVLTSAASQVSLAFLPATGHYVRPCLSAGLRSFVAVGIAVAAAGVAGLAPLAASALAVAVYVLALIALGVLNREEIQFVRSMFEPAADEARG